MFAIVVSRPSNTATSEAPVVEVGRAASRDSEPTALYIGICVPLLECDAGDVRMGSQRLGGSPRPRSGKPLPDLAVIHDFQAGKWRSSLSFTDVF
jgi:hypothetical protein